jgi:hypothetical protein
LGPQRAPEVIVAFGIEGKPVEGVYVSLIPQDGQAIPPSSVATDRDGTAWFHLWDTGRYIARAEYNGKVIEKPFHIAVGMPRPVLPGRWIASDGALSRPPKTPAHSVASAAGGRFQNKTAAEAYFTFLTTPGGPYQQSDRTSHPTRGDRPANHSGNPEPTRTRWSERAWTLLATCTQQGRSAFDFFTQAFTLTSPIARTFA